MKEQAKTTHVIRTKMADAMIRGLQAAVKCGRNPGRVGRRILTNQHQGVGIKGYASTKIAA